MIGPSSAFAAPMSRLSRRHPPRHWPARRCPGVNCPWLSPPQNRCPGADWAANHSVGDTSPSELRGPPDLTASRGRPVGFRDACSPCDDLPSLCCQHHGNAIVLTPLCLCTERIRPPPSVSLRVPATRLRGDAILRYPPLASGQAWRGAMCVRWPSPALSRTPRCPPAGPCARESAGPSPVRRTAPGQGTPPR